jgi:amino acid transporter
MKPQNPKKLKEHCLQALVALSWRNRGRIILIDWIAAAEHAGPAVTLSFVLAAVGCAFAGLCYAEFAMIPVAGSVHLFLRNYGEFMAWIIGWDLVLEYALEQRP